MSQYEKLLIAVLSGRRDSNIAFSDLQKLLELLGFSVRVKGDHFIYWQDGIEEILNIQPDGNNMFLVRNGTLADTEALPAFSPSPSLRSTKMDFTPAMLSEAVPTKVTFPL